MYYVLISEHGFLKSLEDGSWTRLSSSASKYPRKKDAVGVKTRLESKFPFQFKSVIGVIDDDILYGETNK